MKKKILFCIVAVILIAAMAAALIACKDTEEDPTTPEVPETPETPETPEPQLPTAAEIAAARKAELAKDSENYDFTINLSGTFEIAGISQTANANYEGKYRFDKKTSEMNFFRETSGILLYDSFEYITYSGDNRVKLKADENGEVSSVSVINQQSQELDMINLPFVSVVNSLEAENITNIAKNEDTDKPYGYKANMLMTSDNAAFSKVLDILQKQDTSVDIKDAQITNPQGGVTLYFDIEEDGSLSDFCYSLSVTFPVKAVDVTITINYAQQGNDTPLAIPSTDGFIIDSAEIAQTLDEIKQSVGAVKAASEYSLDLFAENDFDPAWNALATVDSYTSRLYKNTQTDRVDFNYSYEYDIHTEEDGAEKFSYIIGNITDGSVYTVSRKGADIVSPAEEAYSADERFDYVTSFITGLEASDISCIEITRDGVNTGYAIHLNDGAALDVQKNILDMINSNTAEGAVDADNYFNFDEYSINSAVAEITVSGGNLAAANISTEFAYYPVGSTEYADERVTLKNSVEITVNENIAEASEYEAPELADGGALREGLENKYIL